MISLSLLFELPGMSLDQVEIDAQTITIKTHVEACEAVCPICQTMAKRVHSHYTRTLHDVPCGTKALRLVVQVRRFFCDQETCPRQIFAERLPALTQVKARETTRFVRGLAEKGPGRGGAAAPGRRPVPGRSGAGHVDRPTGHAQPGVHGHVVRAPCPRLGHRELPDAAPAGRRHGRYPAGHVRAERTRTANRRGHRRSGFGRSGRTDPAGPGQRSRRGSAAVEFDFLTI